MYPRVHMLQRQSICRYRNPPPPVCGWRFLQPARLILVPKCKACAIYMSDVPVICYKMKAPRGGENLQESQCCNLRAAKLQLNGNPFSRWGAYLGRSTGCSRTYSCVFRGRILETDTFTHSEFYRDFNGRTEQYRKFMANNKGQWKCYQPDVNNNLSVNKCFRKRLQKYYAISSKPWKKVILK